MSSGKENEFTIELKGKRVNGTHEFYDDYTEEQSEADNNKIELIIDFYHRFIYRMEYMMRVGKENGYDLISFMGP